MNNAHEEFKVQFEEYDIPIENYLIFYSSENTIAPKVERLLQEILSFGDTLLDSQRYRELSEGSVIQQETWLVSSSSQFYGDLTDTDWEQIFTNLE